jgi:hypothetical protein
MQAVHLNTSDLQSESDVTFLDAVLRMVAGVADVAAVRSIGLVSVLYDERKIRPAGILRAVRSVGFDARLLKPSRLRRRSVPRAVQAARIARA